MRAAGIALLVAGYAAAIAVLTRLVRVLVERRIRWFVILECATGSIVVGWWLLGNTVASMVNAAFLVCFALAWGWTGRRGRN